MMLRDEFGVDYDDVDMDDVQLNRSIKDRRWSYGFILLTFGLIIGVLKNVGRSSPWSLARGRNYQGSVCGVDKNVRDLPYVYYPLDPEKQSAILKLNRGMCVSYCPSEKDVMKKAFITIPEIALLQDKKKETFTTILHSLRSPLYATKLIGKALCIPKEGVGIQFDLQDLFDSAGLTTTRLVASDMYNSVPLLIGLILTSLILSNVIMVLEWNYYILLLCSSSVLLGLSSFKGGFDMASIFVLGVSLYIPVFAMTNWTRINDSYKVASASLSSELPSFLKANLIVQIVMSFFAICGILFYLFLTSQTVLESTNFEASINPNGGIQIVPLQRKPSHVSWLYLSVTLSSISCILILESMRTLIKYCATFTTILWYFKGTESKISGTSTGFYSACQYYIGTLAKCAFTKLFRSNNVKNSTLCELVLLGKSQNDSMNQAQHRILESQQSTRTADCVGVSSINTHIAATAFWATAFIISKSILSYIHQEGLTNETKTASFTAAIIASIVAYIAVIPWSSLEAASDALLYSALVETMTKAGANPDIRAEVDIDFSKDFSRCPEPIAVLLDELSARNMTIRCDDNDYLDDSQ